MHFHLEHIYLVNFRTILKTRYHSKTMFPFNSNHGLCDYDMTRICVYNFVTCHSVDTNK